MKENWDLSGVFSAPEQAENSLRLLQKDCSDFQKCYQEKVANLSVSDFCACLRQYAKLQAEQTKIDSYAYLLHSTRLNNDEVSSFYQNVNDGLGECDKLLAFFENELKAASDMDLSALKQALTPGEYSWIEKCLTFKDHNLSVELEQLFADQESVESYWIRLYDETRSQVSFRIFGKDYTEGEALGLLFSPDASLRHEAGRVMSEHYDDKKQLFCLIYNALLRSRQISSDWHCYAYPCHEANLSNHIDRDDLDNLVGSVIKKQADVSQRYYRLKAKAFGVSEISYWDRNAPYPLSVGQECYSIEDAGEIILRAFEAFSPEFAKVAAVFFDKNLIDYYPYAGKDCGAYCMEMPVGYYPMVFLNFNGSTNSVITMAHELGHAVHEYLSKEQGELGREKSCAQAETASIFAEQLVFEALLDKADTPQKKFALLAGHVENMINTSFRQIAFHRFEQFAADKRAEGELSVSVLEHAWTEYMKDYLGDAVNTDNLAPMWCAIHHFFQYSFYVYSYCFSACVVNSLYEAYADRKVEGFADKYLQMLKNGGIENYRDALARFGIDASDADFWMTGMNLVSRYVDELERLYGEIFPDTKS